MTRRVSEQIEVRLADEPCVPETGRPETDRTSGEGVAPAAFLWRGRVYRVTAVVDHWQERSPWWQATADGVPLEVAGAPRQVWRVSARPGRAGSDGVYDLGLDPCTDWSLLRTHD